MKGSDLKRRRIDAGIELDAFCKYHDLDPERVQEVENGICGPSELFEEVYLYSLQRQIEAKEKV